jgi:hypothetical protein
MAIVPFMEVLPQLFGSFALDGNSVGLLACLAGMAGGWYFSNQRERMKAEKARIRRKDDVTRRD